MRKGGKHRHFGFNCLDSVSRSVIYFFMRALEKDKEVQAEKRW